MSPVQQAKQPQVQTRFSTGNCEATDALNRRYRSYQTSGQASRQPVTAPAIRGGKLVRASRSHQVAARPDAQKVNIGRKITSGAINCITLTPRFPSPPLIPNARYLVWLFGKKTDVAHTGREVCPRKTAHNRAMSINTPKGVLILHA